MHDKHELCKLPSRKLCHDELVLDRVTDDRKILYIVKLLTFTNFAAV